MPSLDKALSILKLFNEAKSEWTAKEVMAELGLHKSSIQRVLSTLEDKGFLTAQGRYNRKYKLGVEILILGKVAALNMDLAHIAPAYLEELVKQAKETAHLCVAAQGKCLYIAKVECDRSIRVASQIGARLPMHCTGVGKVLLSGISEDEIDSIILQHGLIKYTAHTITSREKLLHELESIKKKGVALDNEEFDLGLRCVAAPIFGTEGEIVASISISGPISRINNKTVPIYIKYVKTASQKISNLLGKTRDAKI